MLGCACFAIHDTNIYRKVVVVLVVLAVIVMVVVSVMVMVVGGGHGGCGSHGCVVMDVVILVVCIEDQVHNYDMIV